VNDCAPEAEPSGFTTVTVLLPVVVRLEAGTMAVNEVLLLNVGMIVVPAKFTVEPLTKFVPVRVIVVLLLPTGVEEGLILPKLGTGFPVMVNGCVPVVPPGVVTETVALPGFVRLAAGTMAVNEVLLLSVGVIVVPAKFTVEPAKKLVPVSVMVVLPLPAAAEFGLTLVSVGAGAASCTTLKVKPVSSSFPMPEMGLNVANTSMVSPAETVTVEVVKLPLVP